MNRRIIFHRAKARISVGVDITDGRITLAIAACKKTDTFKKKEASRLLNLRLNNQREASAIFIGHYHGNRPDRDIFGPLMYAFSHLTHRRFVKYVKQDLRNIPGAVQRTVDKRKKIGV